LYRVLGDGNRLVNAADKIGRTPVSMSEGGRLAWEYILAAREILTHTLPTQLHLAASAGNVDAARYLLENGGALVDSRDLMLETPLMYLAAAEPPTWEAMASLLLRHGANVNAECNTRQSAINFALENSNWSILHWLLRHILVD
jgi:ankyrin repeat protein